LGEVNLEFMPFSIDGVALLLIQAGKGRTWGQVRSFEDYEGYIRMPGKALCGKSPAIAKVFDARLHGGGQVFVRRGNTQIHFFERAIKFLIVYCNSKRSVAFSQSY
jgi:hypothetical protein